MENNEKNNIPNIEEIIGKNIKINENSVDFLAVYLMKTREQKDFDNKQLAIECIRLLWSLGQI